MAQGSRGGGGGGEGEGERGEGCISFVDRTRFPSFLVLCLTFPWCGLFLRTSCYQAIYTIPPPIIAAPSAFACAQSRLPPTTLLARTRLPPGGVRGAAGGAHTGCARRCRRCASGHPRGRVAPPPRSPAMVSGPLVLSPFPSLQEGSKQGALCALALCCVCAFPRPAYLPLPLSKPSHRRLRPNTKWRGGGTRVREVEKRGRKWGLGTPRSLAQRTRNMRQHGAKCILMILVLRLLFWNAEVAR